MNSEELELSLRAEFESYLKSVLAEMRQEATEFQSRIEADFDKQKAQFDEAFQGFAARFDSDREFDEAFSGSVAEHLRLARDEGAKITANAMAEAEKMDQAAAPPAANYDGIRDAVNDISSKDSQSAILKSLVEHAAEFAPRGAFFIVKNEHMVGWKVFGSEGDAAESAIREIHIPTSADSILGKAISSLSTVDNSTGAHSDDGSFLDPLHFGQPDRMYAIPLVARRRGVAALYVDYGGDGTSLNREALETLVRVAGLTIELLASTQTAKAENRKVGAANFEDAGHDFDQPSSVEAEFDVSAEAEPRFDETYVETPFETPATVTDSEPVDSSFSESAPFEPIAAVDDPFGISEPAMETSSGEHPAFDDQSGPAFEPAEREVAVVPESDGAGGAMAFDSGDSIESASFESSPFDKAAAEYQPAGIVSSGGFNAVVAEAVDETPAASVPQARLSGRPVDLPIEVPDDQRRIHNDARRFARLLVSEIKLYNEKKVIEGREARDLYERLREAIDRSREMYDKRVQPPVAAKFDYFHYEVINALAEGDADRLGSSYPGSSV